MMFRVVRPCVLVFLAAVAGAAGAGRGRRWEWEVRTRGGVVRGARVPGRDYYAFLGIPYGAPPTGENRFKPPKPAAPWHGVLEANRSRLCVQPRHGGGAEDCLALDVFAPASSSPAAPAPRPVLVYVHGGGFLFNDRPVTAEAVAPLIKLGIIIVTINYRVGALGFLSLDTEEVPGNAGLRDQILALEWIQENIAAFGGEPAAVTLAGTSAGAAAAHLLALAPAGARLLRRLVCMDGTALAGKFIVTYPLTNARKFAKLLGFESDDVSELTRFYKEVSSDAIRNQSLNFFNFDNGELGFAPCVERAFPGLRPVVAAAPQLSLGNNARPMLLTYCDDEGSMRASDLIKNNHKYNTDFPAFMPGNLDFPILEVKYFEANSTKKFYFGNRTISPDLAEEFSSFWGDKDFVFPAVFTAREHVKLGFMAHLLEFTYVGNLSFPKDAPAAPGASHGDVFNYLMPPRAAQSIDDKKVVDEITSIVANFVKIGKVEASTSCPAASGSAGRAARRAGAPAAPAAPAALAFWGRLYQRYRRTDYRPLARP